MAAPARPRRTAAASSSRRSSPMSRNCSASTRPPASSSPPACPEDFELDADSEQLFRVLMNLCRNSVEAMRADDDPATVKRLSITAARMGTTALIGVEDTGPGLPQRRARTCFPPSRARRGPAAPASAWRSRRNSCAPMAARWNCARIAASAPISKSGCPTRRCRWRTGTRPPQPRTATPPGVTVRHEAPALAKSAAAAYLHFSARNGLKSDPQRTTKPLRCDGTPNRPISSHCAPVAQLDRAPDYESGGQRFESFRARHFFPKKISV
jgi:hypothetical protein